MQRRRKLAFFTSFGNGLRIWQQVGTISRELELYRRLANVGWEVHVFSFDRKRDIVDIVGGDACSGLIIHSLFPNWLPRRLYMVYWPLSLLNYLKLGRTMDILKTNQGHSGLHVFWAAKLWRKPFVSRSGYVLSEQLENRKDAPSLKNRIKAFFERVTMRHADICFVPTPRLEEWCQRTLHLKNVAMIPNNINTEIFTPRAASDDVGSPAVVLAVGRLVALKRIEMLIKACSSLNVRIELVGCGPEEGHLLKVSKSLGVEIKFHGRVANEDLPNIYRSASVYVICSEYEGHPKALAEAMSCGCACIGTRSPGIENQFHDGTNGLLVDGSVVSLTDGIRKVLSDSQLRTRIRSGARAYAVAQFSLETLAELESKLLLETINGKGA